MVARIGNLERDPNIDRGIYPKHLGAGVTTGSQQQQVGAPCAIIADACRSGIPVAIVKVGFCPIGNRTGGNMPFCLGAYRDESGWSSPLEELCPKAMSGDCSG